MQVEWRKAVRERSFKLSDDQRRHQRLDGEQLKKRLFFEVVNTDAVIGRLKRERTQMEERLSRYKNERAKIQSQQMLRQMENPASGASDNAAVDGRDASPRRSHQRGVSFEINVEAPSEDDSDSDVSEQRFQPLPPPVFVSKLPGGGGSLSAGAGGGGRTSRRSIAAADGQLFELTESEDELLAEFLERQQRLNEEAMNGPANAAASPRVLIGGLSLELFMKKCRSRHLMDSAIERAETFVDDWEARETASARVGRAGRSGGDGGGGARAHRHTHRVPGGRKLPLAESKDTAGAVAPQDVAGGLKVVELEKLERDFKSLLQEAKKARYLRGRNAEIVERDRELTMDEIFQAAKPL